MKHLSKIQTASSLTVAVLAMTSLALQAQDARTPHFAITNNNLYRTANSASVFQLLDSTLVPAPTLQTNGWGNGGGYFASNGQALAVVGSNVCVFVADPGSADITAFKAGSGNPQLVGAYFDPSGSGSYLGTTLAVRNNLLFAGYTSTVNIGVWTINPDCSLKLSNPASNTPVPAPVDGMAVSPDGHTLVATYAQSEPGVGSFAISGTTLTPRGPYDTTVGTAGVDITKDSKYALIGEYGGTFPQVEIFPINADGTLGASTAYSFPGGLNSNNLMLSPDETRVYITNNASFQVTTLSFNEMAPPGKQLSLYCLSNTLNIPAGNFGEYVSGMATAEPTGKGGYLYLINASFSEITFSLQSAVSVMKIPADGCPVEVSGSPFPLPAGSSASSVIAYPPRPF